MRVSPYTILFSSSFRLTSLLDPNQANSAHIRPPSNASTPSQPSNPSSDHHGAPARLVERDAKKLNPTQRQTRCRGRHLRHLARFILPSTLPRIVLPYMLPLPAHPPKPILPRRGFTPVLVKAPAYADAERCLKVPITPHQKHPPTRQEAAAAWLGLLRAN